VEGLVDDAAYFKVVWQLAELGMSKADVKAKNTKLLW
jgi:hypothetical protein